MSVEVKSDQYLEMAIQTATPEALIGMLYEGAIRFLKQAVAKMDEKDWHGAHSNIVRAQNIVSELNVSLDQPKGGEIASNLGRIYDYVNNRLVEANIKKDARCVSECIDLLANLNSAWHEVAKHSRREQPGGVSLAG